MVWVLSACLGVRGGVQCKHKKPHKARQHVHRGGVQMKGEGGEWLGVGIE